MTKNKNIQFIRSRNQSIRTFKRNLAVGCYLGLISSILFMEPAYADWFQTDKIVKNIVTPLYSLAHDHIGKMAMAVGAGTLILTRGMDLYQKAMGFGIGSLAVAAAIKLSEGSLV